MQDFPNKKEIHQQTSVGSGRTSNKKSSENGQKIDRQASMD